MVVPLLAAGLIAAGATATGVYNVGKAVENHRYWSEYARRTGYSPRYPWRSGRYDFVGATGSTLSSAGKVTGLGYSIYGSGYHPRAMSNDLWYIYG